MDDPFLKHYIPAGCLKFSREAVDLPAESWPLPELQGWRFFTRANDVVPRSSSLPPLHQQHLLKCGILQPFARLFRAGWIQLQSHPSGHIRVYIHPHDVGGRLNRRDVNHLKAMTLLLKQLDYSPSSWNGLINPSIQDNSKAQSDDLVDNEGAILTPESIQSPRGSYQDNASHETHSTDKDLSLLQRFNNIPSPDPQLHSFLDGSNAQEYTRMILEDKIPGVRTKLYQYQRRSVALMLQRELDPGLIIDPRLKKETDQRGQTWYYDSVTGLVLRQPRFYDGIRGGILAEEMGTGKTLICLALILATKNEPTTPPEAIAIDRPTRPKVGSLMDMAAAAIGISSFPWRLWVEYVTHHPDPKKSRIVAPAVVRAIERNQQYAVYEKTSPLVEPRRGYRVAPVFTPGRKVHLSSTSLVIVPNNLVKQWQREITKHTIGLKVLTISGLKEQIPPTTVLLGYDVLLFSQSRFEKIERERSNGEMARLSIPCPLEYIRFKRCIIDEGHKLGNGASKWNTDFMRALDNLEIAARWVVTGTPSRGLYGVDGETNEAIHGNCRMKQAEATSNQEADDLKRIGKIASHFLRMRPWSNTKEEVGDTPADWNVYVLQPQHNHKSAGRTDCLEAMLNTLIIRHRLHDIQEWLPTVREKVVFLEGSYQDKLVLNLFSMMIISNSVQSQRTDRDYFFHPTQRSSLNQLVSNLKQASFFGGVFWSFEDIAKALKTAEEFLERKDVPISVEDHDLLCQAMTFGKVAVENRLKGTSNMFHSMPLYLDHFPGGLGRYWSLDDRDNEDDTVCTDAGMVLALQKFLNPCIDAPTSLNMMMESGRLKQQGEAERARALAEVTEPTGEEGSAKSQKSGSMAGNTRLGEDHHAIPKGATLPRLDATPDVEAAMASTDIEIAEPLAKTRIISTVSAKLSYLIDSIIKYQKDEQILIFYENENVAYYLAGVLEILQIQHLIYSRTGLTAERRAQYVATFTYNPKFRVLLMDISQAAFGLNLQSASRIYFISPVLNPQVEAQAIGRARRISQLKPVSVETLVLKDSIEEFIVERRKNMTQAEHRNIKSVIDDTPTKEWIQKAKIIPLPDTEQGVAQTARLKAPQFVFGRGFGRVSDDPDADLVAMSPDSKKTSPNADKIRAVPFSVRLNRGVKRSTPTSQSETPISELSTPAPSIRSLSIDTADVPTSSSPIIAKATEPEQQVEEEEEEEPPRKKQKKRVRIAWADDDDE